MIGWIRMPLGTKVDLRLGHIVLDGDPAAPAKKGAQLPLNFRSMSIVAKRPDGQDTTWYAGRPRPSGIVWDPAPPYRKGHSTPHFSAHVYCGQTAGWIKMPLGTEVGLGPGDIVLDGNPATPTEWHGKGHSTPRPLFGPCLLWSNGRPSQQLMGSC